MDINIQMTTTMETSVRNAISGRVNKLFIQKKK